MAERPTLVGLKMGAKGKCGKADCGCERKTHAFGAGTGFAVIAAVGVVGAALWFSVKDHARAASPITQAASWYPEPEFLLDNAAALNLNTEEKRHVEISNRSWNLKKAAFDARLKTYNSDSETAISDLKSHRAETGEYGDLLKEFDKARGRAWSEATAPLDSEQVITLDKLRDKSENPKSALAIVGGRGYRVADIRGEIDPAKDLVESLTAQKKAGLSQGPKSWLLPDLSYPQSVRPDGMYHGVPFKIKGKIYSEIVPNGLQPIPVTPIKIKAIPIPLWKNPAQGHFKLIRKK
jgi:hypothetical protein